MKARYKISCALAAILTGCAGVAAAAADSSSTATGVEEVVVTAQRRDETVQKVPMTVQALSGNTLAKLNITTLDDVLKLLPNVSYGNNGPGQGSIFMRGLSAGFGGSQSSATTGGFPNVAVYLDDQSMQFPGRNVDIYMADMDRVEVLEGPQGTLFGGGAQAGAIRYITNKPKLDAFSGNVEAMYGFTDGGSPNDSIQATFNIPLITDKLAVRAVVYDERRGGYIDNVPSEFDRSNNDRGNYYFKIGPSASTGLCPNGLAPGAAGCTLPNTPSANNASVAAKDQNPTTYEGARLSALYKINDDWNILIAESYQRLDAEGVSFEEPIGANFQSLQPLQVTTFSPAYDIDKYENTAWTLNGKIGPLKAVYTGGYMVRNISQQMDYTNYSRTGGGMYYQCTGGTGGLLGAGKPLTCYSPVANWQDTVRNTHLTNELRFSTPDTWRFRAIAGVFLESFKIYDDMNFNYKTIPNCSPQNLAAATATPPGPICLGNVAPAPGATTNIPGERADNTAFGEDVQRGYNQTAFFASIDFDIIPNVLTITGGTRYYHYSEYETGSEYYTSGACVNIPDGQCTAPVNIDSHNDHIVYSGFRSRANITWHITPDTMTYFTFSQGFRPGGFNRSQGDVAKGPDGQPQYDKPNGYGPDSLTNYEIGFKSEFLDHRLQLNLSAYYMDWDNVQFAFFNPTELGNTTFSTNGPNYNVKGLEAQVVAKVTEGLTVQGSGSLNQARQSSSPCLVGNIPGTSIYGQCITQVIASGSSVATPFNNPFGTLGSTPAFSPTFQGNLRARYEWEMGGYKAHAMVGVNYMGGMYNEPATYTSGTAPGELIPTTTLLRYYQPAYATVDAAIGIAKDNWHAEVYGANLGNNHASTYTSSAQFIKAEVPLRPLVVGLRIGASF